MFSCISRGPCSSRAAAQKRVRQDFLAKAKAAQTKKLHRAVAQNMVELVKVATEMSVEEREIFSSAYTSLVGQQLNSYRTLASFPNANRGASESALLAQARSNVLDICKEVDAVLKDTVIPSAKGGEDLVFYHKMKADFYRYAAEVATGVEKANYVQRAKDAYTSATSLAAAHLPQSHAGRLALALDHSVFTNDVMGDPAKAAQIANSAVFQAASSLKKLSETEYKEAAAVLRLLHDQVAKLNKKSAEGQW